MSELSDSVINFQFKYEKDFYFSRPQYNLDQINKMPLLNPADALNHLKTYERGDGLSVQELMDSRTRGGLTVSYFYYKNNIYCLLFFLV